jgi:malate dehydrogenase (quinone)
MGGFDSSCVAESSDVALVGGGIMSATLAAMLKEVAPQLSVRVFEVGVESGREASDGWNNAGTGHAGLCEISYTTTRGSDGSVNVGRAIEVCGQFEISKQFWAHAVASGMVGEAAGFIRAVPHVCFVEGADDVAFLEARHAAMSGHHFFRGIRLARDPERIHAWAPLVMEGRPPAAVAATWSGAGTEVDYGELARRLLAWLGRQEGCGVATVSRVTGLHRETGGWRLAVRDLATGATRSHRAGFVFVGAGGGTLSLLQSTGLPEAADLACFPIGGQWLVCDDPAVTGRHLAKVYGATPPSSPSLGAGHLDVRWLEGRRHLLFGPFASWTTRFLKRSGGPGDLPASLRPGNLATLLRVAMHNGPLVRYLVDEGLQGMGRRIAALRRFYPRARPADWRLVQAGIRVQTIRKADRGAISFGTQLFTAEGGTLAALLGASPGASVSAAIALTTIRTCLPGLLSAPEGRRRMRRVIPTCDDDLEAPSAAELFARASRQADELLGLETAAPPEAAAG